VVKVFNRRWGGAETQVPEVGDGVVDVGLSLDV